MPCLTHLTSGRGVYWVTEHQPKCSPKCSAKLLPPVDTALILGACDPLCSVAPAGVIGQLVITVAAIVLVVLARARRWQSLSMINWTIVCSICWASATCLFAAQWF